MIKKYRRLNEDVQLNNTQTTQQTTTDNQVQNQLNPNQNQSPFTSEDVDKMSDDEVINYVYFNVQDNLDATTKNKLYQRADQIRKNRENGTLNGQNAETMAKGVIADAQQFLKNKTAFKF